MCSFSLPGASSNELRLLFDFTGGLFYIQCSYLVGKSLLTEDLDSTSLTFNTDVWLIPS